MKYPLCKLNIESKLIFVFIYVLFLCFCCYIIFTEDFNDRKVYDYLQNRMIGYVRNRVYFVQFTDEDLKHVPIDFKHKDVVTMEPNSVNSSRFKPSRQATVEIDTIEALPAQDLRKARS